MKILKGIGFVLVLIMFIFLFIFPPAGIAIGTLCIAASSALNWLSK